MQQQFNLTPAFLDLRKAGFVLGLSYQTVRNQIHLDTFPIKTVKIGGRRMVVYDDLMRFVNEVKGITSPSQLSSEFQPELVVSNQQKRGRGRPRNGSKDPDSPRITSATGVMGVGHEAG